MPLFPLQTVRNNSPIAKPELWRNLPLALLRNVQCRFGARDALRTVQLDCGARLKVDMRTGMGTGIYVYKCWEYPVTELLKSVLRPGMCFLDVGANIGYYSIVAAARGARVHAFEPVPKLFEALQESVALNPHFNIFPHRLALAGYTRPTTFYVVDDPENQGLSSLNESPEAVAITIQAQTLDDFVREQKFRRVDLMKVDVEGAEEQVFQGGTDVLGRDTAPDIIFECHTGATSDKVLRTFGYRIFEFRRRRSYEARNLFASKRELPPPVSTLLCAAD